jgi:2-polyprenyl-6-methoxyphenol hydroxylase-like FAD-dependent oxidoreductase
MIFNSFCLGDTVHRHPPFNGLGSNTCIQGAFNLAWKIAYVEKGIAGRSILDSFNAERQPVGQGVVTRANQGLRDHLPPWEALGVLEPSLEASKKAFAELSQPTEKGAARRKLLPDGVQSTAHEF